MPGTSASASGVVSPAKRTATWRKARPRIASTVLDRDKPALADDADAVADPLDLVEVVRGQKDRAAAVAVLGDDGVELLLHDRVKAARRLVEDEQLGVVEKRLDEADLLAVAARELAERSGQVGLEALGEWLGEAETLEPAQGGDVREQLAPGHALREAEVAGQVAQPRADGAAVAATIEAEQACAAARRMQEVQQRADRRRLAGAVGAEESEDLTAVDGQGEVMDAAGGVGVALGQAVGGDDRVDGLPARRRRWAGRLCGRREGRSGGHDRRLGPLRVTGIRVMGGTRTVVLRRRAEGLTAPPRR